MRVQWGHNNGNLQWLKGIHQSLDLGKDPAGNGLRPNGLGVLPRSLSLMWWTLCKRKKKIAWSSRQTYTRQKESWRIRDQRHSWRKEEGSHVFVPSWKALLPHKGLFQGSPQAWCCFSLSLQKKLGTKSLSYLMERCLASALKWGHIISYIKLSCKNIS